MLPVDRAVVLAHVPAAGILSSAAAALIGDLRRRGLFLEGEKMNQTLTTFNSP